MVHVGGQPQCLSCHPAKKWIGLTLQVKGACMGRSTAEVNLRVFYAIRPRNGLGRLYRSKGPVWDVALLRSTSVSFMPSGQEMDWADSTGQRGLHGTWHC